MANLEIEIGAVTSGLDKGLSDSQKKLESFSKSAISVGKKLSLAVTAPLVGLAAISIGNFEKQAQAIGQIEAALLSTGNAAGKSSEELQKTASDLQKISTFGDEEILKGVTAQLLTFTNIAGDAFDRTQLAALNLATRLGGDLQSASIQLGKALNDPVANLSALSRSGIQFSKDQKELINSLVETNRLADAQAIILDELEKQYGGSAEAAAKLGTGPLKQLSNQFGDLLEDVGKIIVEALAPFISKVSQAITFLQGLDDTTKKVIVVIAALAAALGPVLLAIGGIGLALPAIKAGIIAVSAVFTPLTLKIIAVTAAVVALGLVAKALIDSWDVIAAFFSRLWDKVKFAFLEGITAVLKSVNKFTSVIGLDFSNTIDKLKSDADDLFVKLAFSPDITIGDVWKSVTGDVKTSINSIKESITGLGGGFDEVTEKAGTAAAAIVGVKRVFESAIGGGQDRGPTGEFASLDTSGAGIVIPPLNEGSKSAFLESLTDFNRQATQILESGIENAIGDFAFSLGDALGSGANVVDALGGTLLKSIAMIANQLGQAAIAIGFTMDAIQKAFSNPFTAIAAGAALIALAGVISSQVPKITTGRGGGGGGTSGVGQSFSGSGTNTAFVDSFGAMEIVGTSTVKGEDIIISYEKAKRTNGR